MKIHWTSTIIVLAIGYILGVKYPQWAAKVGLSS